MTLVAARQVADAVLYEGYLLYPYRASSPKNQVRWQFGVLGPEGALAAGVGEETSMSAEMVVESRPNATLDIYVRFLQVQSREVQRHTDDGWQPVDELLVDGTRWIPFHEAIAHEIPLPGLRLADVAHGCLLGVSVPAGEDVEELREDGRLVGRLVRSRWELNGSVTVTGRRGVDGRLVVVTVRVDNRTTWAPGDVPGWTARDVAARHSFVGTHLLLSAQGTRFVSLLDGPDWATPDTSSCAQQRCWPVMVSDDEGVDAVLVSPIILGDHPTIAPESAGDLFDATEIDEILTLRIMTMTDQEKADARGTDPRAAAILARCDAMSDDDRQLLHGARRSSSVGLDLDDVPVYGDEVPWWDEGRDARAEPERDSVLVNDVPVAKGSRVLLRPSRRADAQDVFLAGLTAVVSRVYFDVDGGTHVAVVLEDDPASDLYDTTGRFYYFGPEEIEPLPAREDAK
jgi:hypothetical protein